MKIKSQRDFISGLALVIVGLAFAVGSTAYNFGTTVKPGPGYFPFGLGIILAILGAIVFLTSFSGEHKSGDRIGRVHWRSLLCIVGAIIFFGFFLPRLGFVISFPIMIVMTSVASHEFNVRDALLNAFILTTLSYLIFIKALDLNIPMWPA